MQYVVLQNVATMSIKRRVSMHSRPALDAVGPVGVVGAERVGEWMIGELPCVQGIGFQNYKRKREQGLDPEGATGVGVGCLVRKNKSDLRWTENVGQG